MTVAIMKFQSRQELEERYQKAVQAYTQNFLDYPRGSIEAAHNPPPFTEEQLGSMAVQVGFPADHWKPFFEEAIHQLRLAGAREALPVAVSKLQAAAEELREARVEHSAAEPIYNAALARLAAAEQAHQSARDGHKYAKQDINDYELKLAKARNQIERMNA